MYPDELKRFSGALLLPQPIAVHKPRNDGNGFALKCNVRYAFEFGEQAGKQFLKRSKGGLFLDLARQAKYEDGTVKRDANGNAQFAWADRTTLLSAKLATPDLSALLVGYRAVRTLAQAVPQELRPEVRQQDSADVINRKAYTVSLTHKPASAGSEADARATTIISYTFLGNGGQLRVSKSREQVATIGFTLAEELRVFRYFELALDTALRVGGR